MRPMRLISAVLKPVLEINERQPAARLLTHDEAWRIAADETGWTSTQIDCVLDRIAFAQAQCRIEKVTA